jgi:hypothetical protein
VSSAVPPSIGGIGSTQLKLRASPSFDPLKANLGPQEYFLFSRFDGSATLREVLLDSGLPIDRAIEIVVTLRSYGALMVPGETTARVRVQAPAIPVAPRTVTPPPRRGSSPALPGPAGPVIDLALTDPSAEEVRALADDNVLSDQVRRKILAMARLLEQRDPYILLGVPHGADKQLLKHAYFKLSKEIHPDRFYGKRLGVFAERLSTVFEAISRAYEGLTNPTKVAAASKAPVAETAQSPQEYAAELFERACQLEVGGDALGAMKLFSAAVRIDPQTKFLRRSASCALAAGQPRTALEHAKKAQSNSPSDPSLARLLAAAFRGCGRLADAEEVLVMAMALKSENDMLSNELRNDLVEVRRLLNS